MLYLTIFWAVIAALLIIVEAFSTQLVSIWLAIAALATMIVSLFDAPLWVQLVTFLISSVILLIATKPIVKKVKLKNFTPTNSDRYIGQKGIVISEINNIKNEGRVLIDGLDWSARTVDDSILKKEQIVLIKEIQGVKLIVEPCEELENEKVLQKA